MELALGHTIADRYRIEERLGSGAMGIVYRARHIKLARSFAIKVLHPPLTANAKLRKRFQREAETASTLRHRNVVGVVDIGETDNLVYLVMELAEGLPLSALMHEAPLPPVRVIEYVRQLLDGLQHAHDAGLIHRDFKPENVIVERDHAGNVTLRIIDFGIAMLRDGAREAERERLTTDGIVLGTPHYMAPEHASGDHVDHRIDLFALGVICFEMLAGKMPFDGDGVDVARSNLMFDPPAMNERVPYLNVDPLLEAFTRKLMARDRDQRFSSAKAARAVIELIASDRHAAAIELGIAPRPVPESMPPPLSTAARNMLAMPAMGRARPVPNTLEPGVMATLTPRTEAPVRPRRKIWIATAVTTVMVTGMVAFAMTRVDEPLQIAELSAPATPVSDPKPAPTPALEPPPPPPPVIVDEPPPVPVRPVTPRPRVAPKLATQAPRSTQETPSATPSAADVAALYGAVGRALGHLQQSKGSDATIDLWPRFRHIRINDAIATAESRTETHRALQQLQRDVDARR